MGDAINPEDHNRVETRHQRSYIRTSFVVVE